MNATIIITRQKEEAYSFITMLEQHGHKIILLPMIKIEEPSSWEQCDREINTIDRYDGVIFTSSHAAVSFLNRMSEVASFEKLQSSILFAVGEKTQSTINKFHLNCYSLPEEHTAHGLAEQITKSHTHIKRLLFPKGDLAGDHIDRVLCNKGIEVTSIIVYRNLKAEVNDADKKEMCEKLNSNKLKIITFFSPSAVNNFVEIFPALHSYTNTFFAVIGETTKKAVRDRGLNVSIIPSKPASEELAAAIILFIESINSLH